ncbi:MAG: thioredoxin [Bacillota bacterium]|nr:thioredoxin [Bacillota bacterium]
MSGPVHLTDANFETEVLAAPGVTLVDFWAAWCMPCRAVAPVIEQLAEEYAGRAKIGKLNVDENPRMAAQFGIMSIPTLLIFKDGQVVDQIIGAQPKAVLRAKLDEWLGVS